MRDRGGNNIEKKEKYWGEGWITLSCAQGLLLALCSRGAWLYAKASTTPALQSCQAQKN